LSALPLLARRPFVVLERIEVALRYRATGPTRRNVGEPLSFSGFSINHAD
jgi:hypothetical protein